MFSRRCGCTEYGPAELPHVYEVYVENICFPKPVVAIARHQLTLQKLLRCRMSHRNSARAPPPPKSRLPLQAGPIAAPHFPKPAPTQPGAYSYRVAQAARLANGNSETLLPRQLFKRAAWTQVVIEHQPDCSDSVFWQLTIDAAAADVDVRWVRSSIPAAPAPGVTILQLREVLSKLNVQFVSGNDLVGLHMVCIAQLMATGAKSKPVDSGCFVFLVQDTGFVLVSVVPGRSPSRSAVQQCRKELHKGKTKQLSSCGVYRYGVKRITPDDVHPPGGAVASFPSSDCSHMLQA